MFAGPLAVMLNGDLWRAYMYDVLVVVVVLPFVFYVMHICLVTDTNTWCKLLVPATLLWCWQSLPVVFVAPPQCLLPPSPVTKCIMLVYQGGGAGCNDKIIGALITLWQAGHLMD